MAGPTPSKSRRGPRSNRWSLAFYLTLLSTVTQPVPTGAANVLLYSATTQYRHDSIPTAIEALKARSSNYNITFDNTEDPTQFREATLGNYDAVVFLSTTGDVLDEEGKSAFQNYLNEGGNFVGIHAASDSLITTPFYGQQLGAYFDYHPPLAQGTVNVLTKDHPSTSMLPDRWEVTDEFYNFQSDPRALGAVVILSVDESTYSDPGPRRYDQGAPHPTAWYQERGAGVQSGGLPGRSFYTSLGHLNETWQDPLFLSHVLGGISWALASGTTKASNPEATLGPPGLDPIPVLENPSDANASPSPTLPSATVLITSLIMVVLCLGRAYQI